MNITDAELDELLELRRKATAGEWTSDGGTALYANTKPFAVLRSGTPEEQVANKSNARFIAAAANNIESLVTEVKRLRDKLDDVLNDLYHLTNDGNSATLSAFRYIIAVQKELARTKESQ